MPVLNQIRLLLILSLLILNLQQTSASILSKPYAKTCLPSSYYSSLTPYPIGTASATSPELRPELRSELRRLLHDLIDGHTSLPYTSQTRLDTWDALQILDASNATVDHIQLIYSCFELPFDAQGIPSGYNREHLWPKSFGVGSSGADYTDLHALRASSWSVNSARNNRVYDWCEKENDCLVPANVNACSDTGMKSEINTTTTGIFMPPHSVRGDIARALFYMATRYDGSDKYTERLELSDCPCPSSFQMGILSTLLEWHAFDQPDTFEIGRNNVNCEMFQHNRNPYIDYPDLAEFVFAKHSKGREGEGEGCPVCHGNIAEATSTVEIENFSELRIE